MALTYRSVASANGVASVTVAKPAGVVETDLLVAFVSLTVPEPSPPSGWTLVASTSTNYSSRQSWCYVYRKLAGSAEPADYTWTGTAHASQGMTVAVLAFAGNSLLVNVSAADASPPDTIATTVPAPSITPTRAPAILLTYHLSNDGLVTFTPPTGMTERVDDLHNLGGGGQNQSAAVYTQDLASTAATGAKSATPSASVAGWVSFAVGVAEGNVAPNAPTLTAPTGGVSIDRGATNRFSWVFSDPDSPDSQSAYDLRYRVVGAPAWTTVSGTTAAFRDFPGGTFTANNFEWQVRTTDALGLVGPWSASAFFTAADTPAGPSITDPVNGQTIPSSSYTVAWSTASQDSYQLRRVADSAGAADTATVYFDSGEVVGPLTRSRLVTFETNGRWEHVQVRTRVSGLWSAWASVRVNVSYTAPATPTIAVVADSPKGAISVQATHPTPAGGQPTVTSIDVYRREAATGDGIRVAAAWGATQVFEDWAVASGVSYAYRVKANGANNVSSFSAWSEGGGVLAPDPYGGAYS